MKQELILNNDVFKGSKEDYLNIKRGIKKLSSITEESFANVIKLKWYGKVFSMAFYKDSKEESLVSSIKSLQDAQEMLIEILLLLVEEDEQVLKLVEECLEDIKEIREQNQELEVRIDILENMLTTDNTDTIITDKEEVYLDDIFIIEKDSEKIYENKIIYIRTYIKCEGKLRFDNCDIIYNSSEQANRIIMGKNSSIKISNCNITCKGFDENHFIKTEPGCEISINDCVFSDCTNFLQARSAYYVYLKNSKMENCFDGFIDIYLDDKGCTEIENNQFIQNEVAKFNLSKRKYNYTLIKCNHNDKCSYINNNKFIESKEFRESIMKDYNCNHTMIYIEAIKGSIYNCEFEGINGQIEALNIEKSTFTNCKDIIYLPRNYDENKKQIVRECTFTGCTEVIKADSHSLISNCKFISCYDRIIEPTNGLFYGGVRIEFCEFKDIKINEESWLITDSCISFSLRRDSDCKSNYIVNCVFDGVDVKNNFLIKADSYEQTRVPIIIIEDCDFRNCITERSSGAIIKQYCQYYGFFNTKFEFKANRINNCKGLDSVTVKAS